MAADFKMKIYNNGGNSQMKYLFICYPKCTTCKKAQKWLDDNGIEYEQRNIKDDNPTAEELSHWVQLRGGSTKGIFNTSGQLYRSMGLKDKLPNMSLNEQTELLASDGMLVKRPIIVGKDFVLFGFKESQWQEMLLQNGEAYAE